MMNQMIKAVFHALAIISLLLGIPIGAEAPYNSYMIDRDGFYRFAPTLYEPFRVINFDISGVNDMYIDGNDTIYIARDGRDGAEILVFDNEENFSLSIGLGILRGASGVFADRDGLVYAADNMEQAVLVFSAEGELLQKIGRPSSPLFGARTSYKPLKLAVDRQKNMYILSEGSTEGIIQLDSEGEFVGFFGVSMTRISLVRRLQNLLFPPEMMANFIRTQPPSMTNITIDSEGLIYATTKGDTLEPLKKINVAGRNLFDDSLAYLFGDPAVLALEAVTVDQYGNVFTFSNYAGNIIMLDSLGQVIGLFGAKNETKTEMGLTVSPVAIGVNSKQTLYIADKGSGQIQVFTPTPLTWTLFSALALYREGRYIEGENLWRETLTRNSSVAVANNAIALSLTKKGNYAEALGYFRLANNREGYSTAFWEIRQGFLMENLRWVILALVLLSVLVSIRNTIRRRTSWLDGWYAAKKTLAASPPLRKIREITTVFRHPVNAFYGVAREGAVSPPVAAVLTVAAIGLLLMADYTTGFVFNQVNTNALWLYSPARTVILYAVAFFLFVGCNFLIASITDGHGSLSQVFKAAALTLAPIVFLYLPLILLSNVLTLQEIFIFQFFRAFILGWSGVLVIIMVMQVHEFDFREALGNILLTLFAMAVVFTVAIVIYMLARAAFEFFISIFEELYNRG
jgi:hypothetical protein